MMRFRLFLLLFAPLGMLCGQEVAPVVFQQDTLFEVRADIGDYTAQQRARQVKSSLDRLASLPAAALDSLRVLPAENSAQIVLRDEVIVSVLAVDTLGTGLTPEGLATQYLTAIRESMVGSPPDDSWRNIARDIGLFLLSLIVFILLFYLVNRAFDWLRGRLLRTDSKMYFSNHFLVRRFSLITAEGEKKLLLFGLRMLRFTVLFFFLYLYLPFLFSWLHYTQGFGERLLEYVLRPLRYIWEGVTSFLPSFLFIVVILVAVHYLIRAMRYVANQVRSGTVQLSGFYPDWAIPTFNLARVLVIIFTLVIIFPYLPGSGSDAFQGISVFIGLLLSLGSAGVIGNVISGVVLTYMRPFVVGDRVKIGDVTGDVIGKTLLVTKVRTIRNEEITIPNGILMGGGVVNYSSLAQSHGLVLQTSITIGYDVPWTQVHALMLEAAGKTTDLEREPTPFVLQKALNDWYVEYELNAYTKDSHRMARIYSDLHANIQDAFNAAGVEIMSSHYMAVRDGNASTVIKPVGGEPME